MYKFNNIHRKDNWYVFPNAILSSLTSSDCNDTINGVCVNTNDLDECMEICKGNPDCKMGYFIDTGKEGICVPLKHREFETLSPYYRFRNKSYYPELKHASTYVFTKDEYPFPPNSANVIFYMDIIKIANIPVQIIPRVLQAKNRQNYIPVRNGDEISLIQPKTSLILNNEMKWEMNLTTTLPQTYFFKVMSSSKPTNVQLNYQDMLSLEMNSQYLTSSLALQSSPISIKLEPQVDVYYCDSKNGFFSSTKTCKNISLNQTNMQGDSATFQNHPVSRSPNCWGTCSSSSHSLLFILSLFAVIILSIFFFNRKARKSLR